MLSADELKKMVMTFRVSELQMLLGYAGANKTGRKTELQTRALDLLKSKNLPQLNQLGQKIKELYKTIQYEHTYLAQDGRQGGPAGVVDTGSANVTNNADAVASILRGGPLIPPAASLPSAGSYMNQMVNNRPHNMYNNSLYSAYNSVPKPPIPFPVQPDVRFKRLPFYDLLGELLKPSSLVASTGQRDATFTFYLTPQQATDVAMNREVGPSTKNEYSIQVQMRFCLLETSCEQDDLFPPGLIVRVNGKMCTLPNPIPTTRPGVEPKRPPRPVNISNLVKLCPNLPNQITVTWSPEYGRGYVMTVNLVRKLAATDLLGRLKAKGIRHADFTTGLIKEKLREDGDCEIRTTSLRVSLLCPLGKMRMATPCRSVHCSHLQCFDASLYLQMNEKRPTWTCPVCDKAILFDNIVIDGYFQDVLTSPKLPPGSHDIQLHQDGTWSCETNKKDHSDMAHTRQTVAKENKNNDTIEEILDDDDIPPIKFIKSDLETETPAPPSDVKMDMVTIDLTSDDESDSVQQISNSNSNSNSGSGKNMASLERIKPMDNDTSRSSAASNSSPSIIMLDSPSPPPPTISPVLPIETTSTDNSITTSTPMPARSSPPIIHPTITSTRNLVMNMKLPPGGINPARYQPYP